MPSTPQDTLIFRPGSAKAGTGTAKVTFRGQTVEVVKGELLRTALLRRGLTPHNGRAKMFNCRGLAVCGTCAAHITKGQVYPDKWNIHEQMRLRLPPFSCAANRGDMRLACQVEVIEDIEVLKCGGAFGQTTELSDEPAEAFKTYLGEGEFLLDCAQSGFRRKEPRVTIHKKPSQQPLSAEHTQQQSAEHTAAEQQDKQG